MTAQQYLRLVAEEERLGISPHEMYLIAVSVEPSIRNKFMADLTASQTQELLRVVSHLEAPPKAPVEVTAR